MWTVGVVAEHDNGLKVWDRNHGLMLPRATTPADTRRGYSPK